MITELPDKEFDFFISHASEDKEDIAEPLAIALQGYGYKVWLDKVQMGPGSSLSERISSGLANSRFGIVILSHMFFKKPWTHMELGALLAKQTVEGEVIRPIWHGITIRDVLRNVPLLADILAPSTDAGVEYVASVIHEAATRARVGAPPTIRSLRKNLENYVAEQREELVHEFTKALRLGVAEKLEALDRMEVRVKVFLETYPPDTSARVLEKKVQRAIALEDPQSYFAKWSPYLGPVYLALVGLFAIGLYLSNIRDEFALVGPFVVGMLVSALFGAYLARRHLVFRAEPKSKSATGFITITLTLLIVGVVGYAIWFGIRTLVDERTLTLEEVTKTITSEPSLIGGSFDQNSSTLERFKSQVAEYFDERAVIGNLDGNTMTPGLDNITARYLDLRRDVREEYLHGDLKFVSIARHDVYITGMTYHWRPGDTAGWKRMPLPGEIWWLHKSNGQWRIHLFYYNILENGVDGVLARVQRTGK